MAQPPMNSPYGQSPYGSYGGDLQSYGQPGQPPQQPPSPYGVPHWQTQQPLPPLTTPNRDQRPGVIGMSTTMAATASLMFICGLSLAWLTAFVALDELTTEGFDGGVMHIMNRFHLKMINGLALPLFLLPAVGFIVSFFVLARHNWGRIVYTATGIAALAWSGWWLKSDLRWWLPGLLYIGVCCLLVWTPGANRWYSRKSSTEAGTHHY